MKLAACILSLLVTNSALAAYPFTISGDKINAIFQSDQLWRKLGGEVETIVFKGHEGGRSKFAVTTTESVAVVDERGETHFKPMPCLVMVEVKAKGDEMAPKWEVTGVDFSACPKTTGK